MQSIQDQQNALMGAVLPLVPIVHGVSPQMEQIKAALSDVVANAVSTMTNSVESVRSTLVAEFAHGHRRAGSSSKSMPSSRRKRSDLGAHVPVSSPLDSRGHGGPHLSLKRARIEGTTHRALCRKSVPLTNSGDPPPLLRTPQTPRQPLADLLLPVQHHPMNSTSRGYMRPVRAANPARMSRPPRSDSYDLAITRRRSTGLHDSPLLVDESLPSTAGPSNQDALSKALKIEEILEPNLTGVFSIHSSPLSSPPSPLSLARRHVPNETNADLAQLSTHPPLRRQDDIPDTPQLGLVQVPPPSSDPFSNPDGSPPKSMSLRDRRAQMSMVSRKRVQHSPCATLFFLVWAYGNATLHPALVG
jgi:hypothetical protein